VEYSPLVLLPYKFFLRVQPARDVHYVAPEMVLVKGNQVAKMVMTVCSLFGAEIAAASFEDMRFLLYKDTRSSVDSIKRCP